MARKSEQQTGGIDTLEPPTAEGLSWNVACELAPSMWVQVLRLWTTSASGGRVGVRTGTALREQVTHPCEKSMRKNGTRELGVQK